MIPNQANFSTYFNEIFLIDWMGQRYFNIELSGIQSTFESIITFDLTLLKGYCILD
jgi:hypothetical protein